MRFIDWLKEMSDWPTEKLRKVVEDQDAPMIQRVTASFILKYSREAQ